MYLPLEEEEDIYDNIYTCETFQTNEIEKIETYNLCSITLFRK
jgi:hypothetical protein